MNTLEKTLKSYIFYVLSAFGISLGVIANVGVSGYNSMNLAIANIANIKIGTVTIIFNISFLVLYMFLTKFSFKYKYLIQAISVLMFGNFINFFTYTILGNITGLNYIQRIFLISGGTIIGGLSIGMIINYNIITFPLENLCIKLSEISRFTFTKLRYLVDIVSITVSISISLMTDLPLYVREGTIISMLLFTASIHISKEYLSGKKIME